MLTLYFMMTMMLLTYKSKSSWEMSILLLSMMALGSLTWFPLMNAPYLLSVNTMLDSMSLIMLVLSLWITLLMMMASYKTKMTSSKNPFKMILLLLLIILLMCFSINNLIMFYIMFETSLIPILLLIMVWGNNSERVKASFFIMLYTVTASLPLLMMILKLTSSSFHMSMIMPYNFPFPMMSMQISWMVLMMAFLTKLPMFSVHLWLPKAHVEAPVAGSMILAAILLKLGAYGLMRMNKVLNQPTFLMSYLVMSMSIIGAAITNIICIRQTDLKILIAYSSIGHMGLLVTGTLSNSKIGQFGSMIIMLTHGLSSSCMFFLSNSIYEKLNSRNMLLTSFPLTTTPSTSLIWMLVISANMALPPTLNILGEVVTMMSSFFIMKSMILMLMITSLSTSIYSLYLYSMINHGNQMSMCNNNQQLSSINISASVIHLWPLFILTSFPTKLMTWC